jgi:hypothetical protein
LKPKCFAQEPALHNFPKKKAHLRAALVIGREAY